MRAYRTVTLSQSIRSGMFGRVVRWKYSVPAAANRGEWAAVVEDGKAPSRWSGRSPSSDEPYLRAVVTASERPAAETPHAAHDGSVPRSGEVLAGKYRVERVLGVGGMGIVVAARHIHLDVPVALKFMAERALTNHDLVSRFLREARSTARLRGEHVVRVSDVGTLDSGAPYMVMEYLQGLDLAALLAELGPPPIAQAVEYVLQACEGLAEAHRAGLVHRDVKPSNLFLTQRPNGTACIKVLDFGISKAVAMAGEIPLGTSTHAVFGSPLYMAPEQMRAARDVDGRADVWSIGASLYELLSGGVPFAAQTLIDLAYRIANEDPPSLRTGRPEIPPGLEAVVFRCLQKNRDRRFPDALALAEVLAEFRPRHADRDDKPTHDPSRDEEPILATVNAPSDAISSDELETKIMASPGDGPLPAQRVVVVNAVPRSAGDDVTLRSKGLEESPRSSALSMPMGPDTEPLLTLTVGPAPSQAAPTTATPELVKGSTLSWGRSQRLSRRRPRPFLYGVLVLVVGGASSALILHSQSPESPSASASSARASSPVAPGSSTPSEFAERPPTPSIAPAAVAVTDLPRAPPAPTANAPALITRAAPSRPRSTESQADAGRKPSSIGAASSPAQVARPTADKIDPLAP
jgi:eukaryotic-like serine/threonine-protein kinase